MTMQSDLKPTTEIGLILTKDSFGFTRHGKERAPSTAVSTNANKRSGPSPTPLHTLRDTSQEPELPHTHETAGSQEVWYHAGNFIET